MKKPKEILRKPVISSVHELSDIQFILEVKKFVNTKLNELNLKIRLANLNDTRQIDNLVSSRYEPTIAKEISHFDSYRFITFGNVVVIENKESQIVACLYEIGYDTDPKTSFSLRLIIDENYEGLGLSKLITYYSSVLGMARGSKIRKGLIDYKNQTSHLIHLNKLGWVYSSFIETDLEGVYGHFVAEITLDKSILLSNSLNERNFYMLLLNNELTFDFQLVEIEDINKIVNLFSNDKVIIAFVEPNIIDSKSYFLFMDK